MGRAILLLAAVAVGLAGCAGDEVGSSDAAAGSVNDQSPQECMDFHRYVTSGAVTAAELVENCGVTAAQAEQAVAGGNGSPSSTAPPPPPPPPPPPAEGTYGSDPTLDRLQDRCAGGDTAACSDLYWDSPIGSEYESFGQERMDAGASLDSGTDETVEALAMQITWDRMSLSDQVDACDGYNLFGADLAYQFFSSDADDAISFESFEKFFDEQC